MQQQHHEQQQHLAQQSPAAAASWQQNLADGRRGRSADQRTVSFADDHLAKERGPFADPADQRTVSFADDPLSQMQRKQHQGPYDRPVQMAAPRQVLSPRAQDCSSPRAKESQVCTAEALWAAHSGIQKLSEVCSELCVSMNYESEMTSEIQQFLGSRDGAAEAQHALQNARYTRFGTLTQALAASAVAMVEQLEPLRTSGGARSSGGLIPVGLLPATATPQTPAAATATPQTPATPAAPQTLQ